VLRKKLYLFGPYQSIKSSGESCLTEAKLANVGLALQSFLLSVWAGCRKTMGANLFVAMVMFTFG
jgi:hypothetical protein